MNNQKEEEDESRKGDVVCCCFVQNWMEEDESRNGDVVWCCFVQNWVEEKEAEEEDESGNGDVWGGFVQNLVTGAHCTEESKIASATMARFRSRWVKSYQAAYSDVIHFDRNHAISALIIQSTIAVTPDTEVIYATRGKYFFFTSVKFELRAKVEGCIHTGERKNLHQVEKPKSFFPCVKIDIFAPEACITETFSWLVEREMIVDIIHQMVLVIAVIDAEMLTTLLLVL